MIEALNKHKYWMIKVVALAAIPVFAFLQRIDPIREWNKTPDRYLSETEPMLANFDGYYYLSAAREILDGTYSDTEEYRAFPDRIPRSSIPPLLSVLLSGITTVTGYSLNRVGVFLPCFLSLLVLAPVFYLGNRWGGAGMGILAAILTLLSPYFASRTSLGVLDTDCLNVFFALNAICCALVFSSKKGRERYLWLAASLVNYLIFLWWWDQSFSPPTVLGIGPMVIAVLLSYRPERLEGMTMVGAILCLFLIAGMVAGFDFYVNFFEQIWSKLNYISKQKTGLYPNVGESITEQARMGIGTFIACTILEPGCLPLSLFGMIWLFARKPSELSVCLPLIIIGLFTLLFARRFAIFAVPVVAFGFSYFFIQASALILKRSKLAGYLILATGFVYCIYVGYTFFLFGSQRVSLHKAPVIAGMRNIKNVTEKDAVIWSWWDNGHPLAYWSERTTVNDGMVHDGERNHCTALPIIATSDRLAANFIQFYVAHGKKGRGRFFREAEKFGLDGEALLLNILRGGPENATAFLSGIPEKTVKEWLEFLFPKSARPVYLFFTKRELGQFYWIHRSGAWNTKQQSAPEYLQTLTFTFFGMPPTMTRNQLPSLKDFRVSLETNILTLPKFFKKPFPLNGVTVTDASGSRSYPAHFSYPGNITPEYRPALEIDKRRAVSGKYELDIYLPEKLVLIQDSDVADSLICRLFWRKNDYEPKYLQPIQRETPHFQLWKVTGDPL